MTGGDNNRDTKMADGDAHQNASTGQEGDEDEDTQGPIGQEENTYPVGGAHPEVH